MTFNYDVPGDDFTRAGEASGDLKKKLKKLGFPSSVIRRVSIALYEGEMSVSSISELLNMTQPAISHQLKTLKAANLVATRRQGKEIYYHLSDEHVKSIIAAGFEHLIE